MAIFVNFKINRLFCHSLLHQSPGQQASSEVPGKDYVEYEAILILQDGKENHDNVIRNRRRGNVITIYVNVFDDRNIKC